MKTFKNICLVSFCLCCVALSCKKQDRLLFKYDKELFRWQVFDSICITPFESNTRFINMDSSYYRFIHKKEPIYNVCQADQELKRFFASNQNNHFPFYHGNLKGQATISVFSFDWVYKDSLVGQTSGYISIKQQQGSILIFKAYEVEADQIEILRCYHKDGYFILTREIDPNYDISDGSQKKIAVYFCVLKVEANGDISVLDSEKGSEMLESGFFSNLPDWIQKGIE